MAPAIDPTVASKHAIHDLPTPEPESPVRRRKQHKFSTLCATVENPGQKDQYGSSSVPIYQTATFKGTNGEYDYSRSGNLWTNGDTPVKAILDMFRDKMTPSFQHRTNNQVPFFAIITTPKAFECKDLRVAGTAYEDLSIGREGGV